MLAVTVCSWLWDSAAARSARRRRRRSLPRSAVVVIRRISAAPTMGRRALGSWSSCPTDSYSGGGVSPPKIHLVSTLVEELSPLYSYSMAFLDTKRDRGAFLIFMLGLGLVYALWPFSTG